MWLSLAAFIHNILMNGANNVVISSLQKEFYITSKETGAYVSVYDVGSLISSIMVPVLSAKRGSRPKWVAFGMIMLFTGCMVNVIPHFLRSRHSIYAKNTNKIHEHSSSIILNDASVDFSTSTSIMTAASFGALENSEINQIELCNYSFSQSIDHQQHLERLKANTNLFNSSFRSVSRSSTSSDKVGLFNSFLSFFALKHLLYVANFINGMSSASLTSLAFSYIEDIAPHNLSSIYESIYFAVGALGVGVG